MLWKSAGLAIADSMLSLGQDGITLETENYHSYNMDEYNKI